jgi:hypothetical protein
VPQEVEVPTFQVDDKCIKKRGDLIGKNWNLFSWLYRIAVFRTYILSRKQPPNGLQWQWRWRRQLLWLRHR